jgi:hypothetical protein
LPEALQWWDGDWYGWWIIARGSGRYSNLAGEAWDCYATIDVRSDSTATVTWWDDDIFMGEVEIEIALDTYWAMGVASVVGGTLFDDPAESEAWILTPDISDYENIIEISEWHEDQDGNSFRYEVYLRPWGMLWDDVPSDRRPPDYDWYLGVRNMNMEETLGGTAGSGGGADSGEQGPDTSPPVPTDGGWIPMSDQRAASSVLADFFNVFWRLPRAEQLEYTYEQIIEIVGCEPSEFVVEDPSRPNITKYRWNSAELESRHMYFIFDDVGGGQVVINNWGSAGL